jgi:hypothetical protein
MRIAISIVTVLSLATSVHAKSYDMSDLDALEKSSSWQELLDHAEDIAPSQRNGHWSQLIEEAATGVLAGLDADKVSFTGLSSADTLTRRYPQLKKSKAFMAKRADVGLRAFARCFELTDDDSADSDACATRLAGFTDGDPDNADLARRSIAMIETHFHYTTAGAFPIYYRLIAGKKGAKDCSTPGAKRATISALGLDKADSRVAQAREIASTLCWDQMQNDIVDALGKPQAGAHYFENSCGFLVDKKALGNLQTTRCKALPK